MSGCLVVAFALLGRWQWRAAWSGPLDLQNLLYAVEWWLFGAAVVVGWGRLVYEELNPKAAPAVYPAPTPNPQPVAAGEPEVPAPQSEADEILASYNAYLARLHADPRARKTWSR